MPIDTLRLISWLECHGKMLTSFSDVKGLRDFVDSLHVGESS